MSPKYSLRLDVRLLEDLSLTSQELTELLQVRAEKLIRRLDIRHSNAHPYQLFEYFSWYAYAIAFPKTQKGICPLTGAPDYVEPKQLK